MNAHVRPIPLTLATSVPLAPGQAMCGLHEKPRSMSNLTWQSNPRTKIPQMICKPGQECATRSERLYNAEYHGPHAGSDTATNQNNLEAGTDYTSESRNGKKVLTSYGEAANNKNSDYIGKTPHLAQISITSNSLKCRPNSSRHMSFDRS